MKKIFISSCIATCVLLTTNLKAQTVIDGKHWYKVRSNTGQISIPTHCVITYIGAAVEGARGGEKIKIDNLSYRFVQPNGPVAENYTFVGEIYTGDEKLEISIENARKESMITVCYYN